MNITFAQSIEFIKKYNYIILFCIIIILTIISIRNCRENSINQKVNTQNINAITDKLRIEKNKADQLTYVNTSYVLNIEDLKKVNSSLALELNKEKGKSKVFTQTTVVIKHDTINLTNTIKEYPNNLFSLSWKNEKLGSDYYSLLSGESNFIVDTSNSKYIIKDKGTKITNDILKLTIYNNLREYNGKYEITSRSNYPGVELNSISNISPEMIQKDKYWAIGIGLGFGLGTKYNGTDGQFGWTLSVGVTYNILTW